MDDKPSRDRHDQHWSFRFYGPIVITFSAPIVAILTFIFAVYVITHWTQFVTILGYLPFIVGIPVGTAFMCGVVLLMSVAYNKFEEGKRQREIRKAEVKRLDAEIKRLTTVMVERDEYAIVSHDSGELEMFEPSRTQLRLSAKVPEQAMLPAPQSLPQLSGRQLIVDGHVEQALAAGKYLLGYDESGQVRMAAQRDLYNMLLAGIPGSGKSTTGLWLAGQRVKAGGLYMASDPHLNYQDDQGRKSLGESLAPFASSRLIETDDGSVSGLFVKLNHMLRELAKRQKPGYVVRAQDNWLWIIDEFNSAIDAVDDAGKTEQFAKGLALLQREGRKYGLHLMIMGHRFSRDDIGKVKIRSVASNILCAKMTDINQAKTLIGSSGSKACDLRIGDYLLSGIIADGGIEKIHTPLFETSDMPLLFGSSSSASNPASRGASRMDEMDDVEALGKYASRDSMVALGSTNDEDFMRKVRQVLDLERQPGMSTREIIRRVWGIEYKGRSGQAAAEELKIVRKYIADKIASQF